MGTVTVDPFIAETLVGRVDQGNEQVGTMSGWGDRLARAWVDGDAARQGGRLGALPSSFRLQCAYDLQSGAVFCARRARYREDVSERCSASTNNYTTRTAI